jgi:hypothetical protein
MMEMELILSEITRLWDIHLQVREINEKPMITLRPLEPVMIKLGN